MNLTNEFYEAYNLDDVLLEHAMKLKDAKMKVEDLSHSFLEHFALIGMLGKSNINYEHWKNEIANFCKQLDNIKIKNNNKFDSDYFIDTFMSNLDTDNDAEIDANAAWVSHKMDSILNYNFTREDFKRYKEFRNECFKELALIFSNKEDHSKEYFENYIEEKINKYKIGF